MAIIATPSEADIINREAARNFKQAYFELIYAVGIKHPNETRHETALRYIKQAEMSDNKPEQASK